MPILTETQTKEIIDGAMEQIKNGVVEEAKSHISWVTKDAVEMKIREVINKWVEKEVAPELVVSLNKNKSAIMSAAVMSAQDVAKLLADVMTKKLAENLTTSYKRNNILKALFD